MTAPQVVNARRTVAAMVRRTTVLLVLMTFAYYAFPLRMSWSEPSSWARLVGSALAVALIAVVLAELLRRGRRREPKVLAQIETLAAALYLMLLGFALTYAVIELHMPGEFAELNDRTDALYFATATMATVGFGDVHAIGTLARVLVTVQMVVNLVYIGAALRVLTTLRSPDA